MRFFLILIFFYFTSVNAEETTKEYNANEIKVLNNSAIMYQTKNYWITSVTGPVGSEGIPKSIKFGDIITVEGKSIKANIILVTEHKKDLIYSGEYLARKGDINCLIIEREKDNPTLENDRSKKWINIKECKPIY